MAQRHRVRATLRLGEVTLMTDAEYLTSTDPIAMWNAISNRVSVDACKRFVLECQRRWRDLSFTPDADWKDTAGGLVVAISDFNHFRRTDLPALIREAFGNPWRRGHVLLAPADCSKRHIPDICCPICDGGLRYCTICRQGEVELDEPCFRFDVTAAIRDFAISIRDHDDWAGLPVLADMLEESGCQAVELLRHLRGGPSPVACEKCDGRGYIINTSCEGIQCKVCSGPIPIDPHCRGCWALAAVIGGGE